MITADTFSFQYPTQDNKALSNISFSIDDGEVLGVVGPVEAGKTTLSMALASFAPQNTGGVTEGTLSVAGRDPQEAKDNDVAMVFEDYPAQLTQVRVVDEVIAPLVNRGVAREEAQDRAHNLLERVQLSDVASKFTWELSGGQQQRLAIAAALAIDPEVMIFDTATDMLDPEGREDVANLVASLAGEKTLVVTHNEPDELVGVADKLLVLDEGEQIAFGPADALLRNTELLEQIGVRPPMCSAVAQRLEMPDAPLTPGEFLNAIDGQLQNIGDTSHTHNPSRTTGTRSFGEPLLRVEGATYEYGPDEVAIKNMDLTIREGEVHAVIGGNGAGKTTFSKLLSGLFKPDYGTVYVNEEPTDGRAAREIAESVGLALQNPDEQISEQTVEAELRFPLERRQTERTGLLGLSKRERYDDAHIDSRVETVRERVGLRDTDMDADPMFLPRGKRRQVTIGSALMPDPDVLVLDEPVAGVDATTRAHVTDVITDLRNRRKGVVIIDHDMDFICEIADTVTVLDEGTVAMQGRTEEVFAFENWEWLSDRHLQPPRVARLGQRVGAFTLTTDAFVETFAPELEVSR